MLGREGEQPSGPPAEEQALQAQSPRTPGARRDARDLRLSFFHTLRKSQKTTLLKKSGGNNKILQRCP